MPSSVIFVGLVVLWLLILVPAVARRQQEVARLSPALLSGRVLERPMRHRFPEVGVMERLDDRRTTTVGELVERRDDVPSPRDHDTADALERELDDELALDDERDDHRDDHFDDERRTRDADDVRAVRYDPHTASDDEDSATDRRRADDLRTGDPDADDLRADDSDADDRDLDDRDLDDQDADDLRAHDPHADDLHAEDDRQWERPPARYRPGRGGFDPEAAAVAAHAKYAFRQRVVLGLLVLLLASGAAALLVSGLFWW
ncbi:MAG: gephyrin-like molybdotransferase receptor GlpR, partial [Pseudonocardia sediminis]